MSCILSVINLLTELSVLIILHLLNVSRFSPFVCILSMYWLCTEVQSRHLNNRGCNGSFIILLVYLLPCATISHCCWLSFHSGFPHSLFYSPVSVYSLRLHFALVYSCSIHCHLTLVTTL